jgi:hypothetical protein
MSWGISSITGIHCAVAASSRVALRRSFHCDTGLQRKVTAKSVTPTSGRILQDKYQARRTLLVRNDGDTQSRIWTIARLRGRLPTAKIRDLQVTRWPRQLYAVREIQEPVASGGLEVLAGHLQPNLFSAG